MVKNSIKINIIGDLKKLPKKIKKRLQDSVKRTGKCRKILVNLALNYGSKNEIINSIRSMRFKKQNISIKNFERNLYTKNLPDPDLLIRTGGKKRLSNFLLWQLAYSELYFLDKLWPDFTTSDFNKIIKNFKRVKRNFGKIWPTYKKEF